MKSGHSPPFLVFPEGVRRIIYTMDDIDKRFFKSSAVFLLHGRPCGQVRLLRCKFRHAAIIVVLPCGVRAPFRRRPLCASVPNHLLIGFLYPFRSFPFSGSQVLEIAGVGRAAPALSLFGRRADLQLELSAFGGDE